MTSKTKLLTLFGDVLLLVLLLGGVAWLLASGTAPQTFTSDRQLFPLSVDGSKLLLLGTALSIVLGLALAALLPRRAERWANGHVVRYSGFDRLVHWATALGFVLAFATAVLLLRWFGVGAGLDARPAIYQVHYAAAILITVAALLFVATYRTRGQDGLVPRWSDVSPAVARLFAYLGIYGQHGVLGLRWPTAWQRPTQRVLAALGIRPNPREGKFLAVEKVLSFTPLALLTLLVIVTGLIKAAHYFFTMPPGVLERATWLHDLGTQGTVLVLGAHLAAIFLVPRNWPGIAAMTRGSLPRHVVHDEFPAWADQLDRTPPPAPAPNPNPSPAHH